jgi:hypothetical protein
MAGLARHIAAGILGSLALLHPREAQFVQGALGSVNAEVICDCDGSATVSLDLRGGAFNLTCEVAGSVDGVNWTPIPVKPVNTAAKLYVAAVTGAVPGVWMGSCAGYRKVRARCTAYTSGAATTTLVANTVILDQSLDGLVATPITVTAAVGLIATLSIPAPGAGLRNYLTYIAINRIAGLALTAAAVPVVVTTANLPNAMAFSLPADAAAQGTLFPLREDFAYPLISSAQNVATTIVGPATTGVIWRISAAYYVAP